MDENEMNLDEPATRRDLKELEVATRRDLKELETRLSELISGGFANHPTHAELDASLRQIQLHIEANRAESRADLAQHAKASLEAFRVELAQQTSAIAEDNRRSLAVLDDKYRNLPDRVTKLETAVFSPPPKPKPKAG